MTIQKKKFYKLLLNTIQDTAEAIFAIASVSHEKKQTFLGKMRSKNDEGKDAVLDYNRDVPGIINTGKDSAGWIFFIENFTSGGRQTEYNFSPSASMSGGYMKNDKDSFYLRVYSSFSADIVLINQQGEDVGALAFKQKHPDIWIRNNIDASYQYAIAVFFAVIQYKRFLIINFYEPLFIQLADNVWLQYGCRYCHQERYNFQRLQHGATPGNASRNIAI